MTHDAPVRIQDLDYALPPELIAQHPAARREDARLLVVERAGGALHDRRITDLPEWLRAGDVLALNETRVFPARLHVRRDHAPAAGDAAADAVPGARIELLFVRPEPGGAWRVLARPAKRAAPGGRFRTEAGDLVLEVTATGAQGERTVRVVRGDLHAALAAHGEVPLPPYIHRPVEPGDRERYQTVYARVEGAVAAPTAGLHFTPDLLDGLAARGVARAPVLLHVGPGTFRPVGADDAREHVMDEEYFEVPAGSAAAMRAARGAGGRVVAVGTTVVRALESACDAHGGALEASSGWTRKYILPPYRFQAVDALLTNFHLPRTTLLLLVAAFAGPDVVRRAYAHAVAERYRFYSYGDAMLIV